MTRIIIRSRPCMFIMRCTCMGKSSTSGRKVRWRGPSLEGLFKMLPDEKAATECFESDRMADGHVRPWCWHGRTRVARPPDMPYCRFNCKHFGVKTGAVMERSKTICLEWTIRHRLGRRCRPWATNDHCSQGWSRDAFAGCPIMAWLLQNNLCISVLDRYCLDMLYQSRPFG